MRSASDATRARDTRRTRRRIAKHRVRGLVTPFCQRTFSATVQDISERGAQLITSADHRTRLRGPLLLKLVGPRGAVVASVRARVAHSRTQPDGRLLFGCEFVESARSRRALETALPELTAGEIRATIPPMAAAKTVVDPALAAPRPKDSGAARPPTGMRPGPPAATRPARPPRATCPARSGPTLAHRATLLGHPAPRSPGTHRD